MTRLSFINIFKYKSLSPLTFLRFCLFGDSRVKHLLTLQQQTSHYYRNNKSRSRTKFLETNTSSPIMSQS